MIRRYITLSVFSILSASAMAGTDYWRVSADDFNQVEQMNNSTKIAVGVRTGVNSVIIYNVAGSNPCTIDHMDLVPPAGKEARWMNLLLTAISTGRSLILYGDCDTANKTLTVDALTSTGRLTLSD